MSRVTRINCHVHLLGPPHRDWISPDAVQWRIWVWPQLWLILPELEGGRQSWSRPELQEHRDQLRGDSAGGVQLERNQGREGSHSAVLGPELGHT